MSRKGQHRVKFDLSRNTLEETWSKFEYERVGDFDMEAAMEEWDREEDEERMRQNLVCFSDY